LDDKSQASAAGIIDVMRRIGGMAKTLKMPAREAAALGSTFLHMGSSAEVAATASNAVMRILGAATIQSKSVRSGLSSIGFAPESVQRSMAKNATGTIQAVMDKLNALNSEQRIVASTRIFGAEYGDDIAKLATGADEYRRQLALVRGEEQKGSMAREFNARLKTTAAQWQLTKNRMTEVGVAIGGALLPALNDLLKAAGPMVEKFAAWSMANTDTIKTVVGTTLALSGLRVVATGISVAFATIEGPVISVMGFIARWRATGALAAMGRFGPVAMRVVTFLRTIGTAIAAIGGGPVAIAVAAITAGALIVRKYWEPIKAFMGGVWDGFKSAVQPAIDSVMASLEPFKPAWDAVSLAVSDAWDSVMKFLEPVTMSKSELEGVASVGKIVGDVIANSFTIGATVIGGVIDSVVWLGTKIGETAGAIVVGFETAFNKVKTVVGATVDWIVKKMQPIIDKIGFVSSGWGGLTGSAAALTAPKGKPQAPRRAVSFTPAQGRRIPPMTNAPARSGRVVNDHSTVNITVNQRPGESHAALVDRLTAEIDRRKKTKARGSLVEAA
jgi:phage-related tail protein